VFPLRQQQTVGLTHSSWNKFILFSSQISVDRKMQVGRVTWQRPDKFLFTGRQFIGNLSGGLAENWPKRRPEDRGVRTVIQVFTCLLGFVLFAF
jgi:hypothetical protein